MSYFGFLAGPPLIGLLADHITLRGALWLVVLLSALLIPLSPAVATASATELASRSPEEPVG